LIAGKSQLTLSGLYLVSAPRIQRSGLEYLDIAKDSFLPPRAQVASTNAWCYLFRNILMCFWNLMDNQGHKSYSGEKAYFNEKKEKRCVLYFRLPNTLFWCRI
jgi:hypothetical protein